VMRPCVNSPPAGEAGRLCCPSRAAVTVSNLWRGNSCRPRGITEPAGGRARPVPVSLPGPCRMFPGQAMFLPPRPALFPTTFLIPPSVNRSAEFPPFRTYRGRGTQIPRRPIAHTARRRPTHTARAAEPCCPQTLRLVSRRETGGLVTMAVAPRVAMNASRDVTVWSPGY